MSTSEQELDGQVQEIRKFARARGWKLVHTYSDHGESGANSQRPAYRKLMHDAAMRRFDLVVVWRIDRFGRSLLELLGALEELDGRGVKFVSVQEQHIDTSRPEGRLMLQLLASFAQFERELISERTKLGIAAWRRRHGNKWGRPRRTPPPAEVLDQVEAGFSKTVIAEQLGCSVRTVRRLELEARALHAACNGRENSADKNG